MLQLCDEVAFDLVEDPVADDQLEHFSVDAGGEQEVAQHHRN
jgi:hypothetical protein